MGQSEREAASELGDPEHLRLLVSASPVAMMILDPATSEILDANAAACSDLEMTPSTLVGTSLTDVSVTLGLPGAWAQLRRRLLPDHTVVMEAVHRKRAGEIFPVEMRLRLSHEGEGSFIALVARNVAERSWAEHRLERALSTTRALLEALPDMMFQLNREGVIVEHVIPALSRDALGGATRTVSSDPVSLLPPSLMSAMLDRVEETLRNQRTTVFEHRVDASSTEPARWYEARMAPMGGELVVVILTDVSERRQLELQIRQAEKMSAVGRLAGGVAHDLNNVLTAILGNCDLLLGTFPDDDERRTDVTEIQSAALRAASLTRQLLAFSRRGAGAQGPAKVDPTLVELRGMLGRVVPERIEIDFDLGVEERASPLDAAQLEQVMLNLLTNAVDAIATHGTIHIRTGMDAVDAARAAALGLPFPETTC